MGKLQRFYRPKTVQVTRNTLSTETLISKHVHSNKTRSISTHWKNKRSMRLSFTKHPLYRIATTVSITLSLMHLFITDQGLLTSRLWIFVLKSELKFNCLAEPLAHLYRSTFDRKSPSEKNENQRVVSNTRLYPHIGSTVVIRTPRPQADC